MPQTLKDLIADARERVIEDPEAAVVRYTASSHSEDGVKSEVRIRHHGLTIDEQEARGGGDRGPNPVELVLAALGTCQIVTYRAWAAALGIPLDDIRVDLEGELDLRGSLSICPNARVGLRKIRGTVHLSSTAPDEALARLRRAVEEHCPVLDTLAKPVAVSLEIARQLPARAAA